MIDLKKLAIESHGIARSKGWWDCLDYIRLEPFIYAAKLALVHSEISEATEELRRGRINMEIIDGKPEGLDVELADTIIRILDLSEQLGLDIEKAIEIKIAYNKTRTIRHGRKAF